MACDCLGKKITRIELFFKFACTVRPFAGSACGFYCSCTAFGAVSKDRHNVAASSCRRATGWFTWDRHEWLRNLSATLNNSDSKMTLRCPGTLFISHEHANFPFSVFRVVHCEAKTPKIMGCCRAIFAFLHALKIGTFHGKWTSEWVFKTSHFFRLALYSLINSKLAFSLHVSERCLTGTAKKSLI